MKKFFKYSLLLGLFSSTTALASNVAMINTSYIFKEHPLYEQTKKELSQLFDQNVATLKSEIGDKLEKKAKEIEEYTVKLGDERIKIQELQVKSQGKKTKDLEARIKKYNDEVLKAQEVENEYNRLNTEYQNKKAQLQQLQNEKEQSAQVNILTDIQNKSIDYAKANKYDVILDSGSVVYIHDKDDITEKVLEHIKQNFKK